MGYRKIKQYRSELGLTQGQLAGLAGIKQENVSRYENGKITSTPKQNLEAIAAALSTKDRKVTVKDLYDGEDDRPSAVSNSTMYERLKKIEQGIGSLMNENYALKAANIASGAPDLEAPKFTVTGESVQMKVARAHEAQQRERLSV